jgi:hypothetical protein
MRWQYANQVVNITACELDERGEVARRQEILNIDGVRQPHAYYILHQLLSSVVRTVNDLRHTHLAGPQVTMILADLMDFMQANQGAHAAVDGTQISSLPAREDLQES